VAEAFHFSHRIGHSYFWHPHHSQPHRYFSGFNSPEPDAASLDTAFPHQIPDQSALEKKLNKAEK
jgi:hypothetical protein